MNSPWPKQMRQKFPGGAKDLAAYAYPEGSTLRCNHCNVERHCTTEEITEFIRNGYPACKRCGTKVQLLNPHIKKVEFE